MKILYQPNSRCQQRQFEKPNFTAYPVLLAMEATYMRNLGHRVYWDEADGAYDEIITAPQGIPFLKLPAADRVLTKAFDKKYQANGNFKYHPGTYIQAANGCWHGKCTFCVEQKNKWQVRPINSVIAELEQCKRLGFKEVFDDSGTFPMGQWLEEFLDKVPGGLTYGCNMRMVDVDYSRMASKGFRMLLFGLESANQNTLDKINKGVKVEDIKYIIKAAKAGLDVHITCMFGYPWETESDSRRTLELVHYLLRRGYAKTAQASFFNQQDVVSCEHNRNFVRQIYNVKYSPQFWFHQLKDIRNVDDIKYLWKKIKAGLWKK